MAYLDVVINDSNLEFSDGTVKPASEEEKGYFSLRKKLKAIKQENGEYKIIRWADLHRHSGYSLLDGAILPEVMADKTEYVGAITDHGNMCGAMKFYNAMKKQGKQPIMGEEFYCEDISGNKTANHLILLAKNDVGYRNLIQLSSEAYENVYRKPQITYEKLKKYHEGLVCTTACLSGELPRAIRKNLSDSGQLLDAAPAITVLKQLKDVFGDDLYVEIQRHHIEIEPKINYYLRNLAKLMNIKCTVATDSHFVNFEDKEAHDALLCISTRKKMTGEHPSLDGDGYHIHTADEIEALFYDMPDAIDNTLEIAEKCEGFEIKSEGYLLPKFDIPDKFENEYDYMEYLTKVGLKKVLKEHCEILVNDSEAEKKRKSDLKEAYIERCKYELSVIKRMGFAGYFLIVKDFLDWARNNGITIGPGRGSAAGSLVIECLHITEVDPLEYNLLFERFLNPDRISMPDIDSDISKANRGRLIDYVNDKYGKDHVSHIIAFGTLSAKAVITEVSKIYGYTPQQAIKVSKMIPATPNMTIERAIKESKEFKKWAESEPHILEIAKKLEGLPRNVGTHACGICITPNPVHEYIPQMLAVDSKTKEHFLTTQFDKDEVEKLGILKMDFLGLRTLDVEDEAIGYINERNPELKLTPAKINIFDSKIYKFLADGHSDGVFQFESPGMKSLLKDMFSNLTPNESDKELGKRCFEALFAATALYRPGPMDEIPNYIKGKNEGARYDVPMLEPILKETFGIFVYQEQVMRAVRDLAGFSAGQSDKVRKGMAKKINAILDEYGDYFVNGSPENGIAGCEMCGMTKEQGKALWKKMEKFGEYAFNQSHAVSYAISSARTAWLSCYYPYEFMTAVLNSYIGDYKKMPTYLFSCKNRGLTVIPPDVNYSESKFAIDYTGKNPTIKFGLSAVKGVGVFSNAIVEERNKNGKFVSLNDFVCRMSDSIDFGAFQSLAGAGALKSLGINRATLLDSIGLLKIYKKMYSEYKTDVSDELKAIFGTPSLSFSLVKKPEMSFSQMANYETELLGCLLSNPVDYYSKSLKGSDVVKVNTLSEKVGKKQAKSCIFGIIQNKEKRTYQKKDGSKGEFLKFDVDDCTGIINCVAFKNINEYNIRISDGDVVKIFGDIENSKYGLSCKVQKIDVLQSDSELFEDFQ